MDELTNIQKRAIASAKAKTRLVKAHHQDYERFYREECAKFGLKNNPTRAQRIARLRAEMEKLRANYSEDECAGCGEHISSYHGQGCLYDPDNEMVNK